MENSEQAGGTSPLYIGPKEVKVVDSIAEKYNGTIDLVKVTYADGTTETLSKKLYDVSTTVQASDFTALRSQRANAVVQNILAVLLDWGVPLVDVNFICASVPVSINASIDAANTKLWGKPENTLNLIEIDKMLKDKVTLNDIIPPEGQGPVQQA